MNKAAFTNTFQPTGNCKDVWGQFKNKRYVSLMKKERKKESYIYYMRVWWKNNMREKKERSKQVCLTDSCVSSANPTWSSILLCFILFISFSLNACFFSLYAWNKQAIYERRLSIALLYFFSILSSTIHCMTLRIQ